MRPEAIAFRELELLVRNLSEQLAQFRRRALTAEGKNRELELQLKAARVEFGAEKLELSSSLAAAELRIAELEKLPQAAAGETDARSVAGDVEVALSAVADERLRTENEALRQRLDEARSQTEKMVERVRFLRHQLESGQ